MSRYLLILASFSLNSLIGATPLSDTRNILDEWVETRQIISKELSEWKTEQSLLNNTQSLLSRELSRLESELEDLEASSTASDEERSLLAAQKESLKEAESVVSSSIGGLENQLKAILPSLPKPLIEKIKPLIRRLPDDPRDTDLSLGQRVQNIVGILSQTDKFNTTITISSEAREFEPGKAVQVTTLYWGLAMAYYVDDSGKYGGIGIPTVDGWEWPVVDGIASDIRNLVDIYEGTGEIQFINAPAKIKTL